MNHTAAGNRPGGTGGMPTGGKFVPPLSGPGMYLSLVAYQPAAAVHICVMNQMLIEAQMPGPMNGAAPPIAFPRYCLLYTSDAADE